jgi:hypothetical protein
MTLPGQVFRQNALAGSEAMQRAIAQDGRLLGEASSGAGVDVIAYDQKLSHVYVPGAHSGTIAIVGISDLLGN